MLNRSSPDMWRCTLVLRSDRPERRRVGRCAEVIKQISAIRPKSVLSVARRLLAEARLASAASIERWRPSRSAGAADGPYATKATGPTQLREPQNAAIQDSARVRQGSCLPLQLSELAR
jgi:hypothetical protein